MTLPGRIFIASALGLLAGSGLADAYNSEEHKILVDWGASMVRPWRGATYRIAIARGPAGLELDGRRLEGNVLPPPRAPGEVHEVRATVHDRA